MKTNSTAPNKLQHSIPISAGSVKKSYNYITALVVVSILGTKVLFIVETTQYFQEFRYLAGVEDHDSQCQPRLVQFRTPAGSLNRFLIQKEAIIII